MKLEQGKFCPLIGKDCIQMQCSWFTQVRGQNPQTGEPVDEWGCAVTWLPLLLIENSNQTRQAGAAIESFRNETVKSTMKAQEIYQRELEVKAQERLMQSRQTLHISPEVGE
tara:strand:+ start:795 stop:1130 length:336 start_codon:yes stop_codon:yes gene_type:complete